MINKSDNLCILNENKSKCCEVTQRQMIMGGDRFDLKNPTLTAIRGNVKGIFDKWKWFHETRLQLPMWLVCTFETQVWTLIFLYSLIIFISINTGFKRNCLICTSIWSTFRNSHTMKPFIINHQILIQWL